MTDSIHAKKTSRVLQFAGYIATLTMLASVPRVLADIFVTKTGDEIEGELIKTLDKAYRLRTRLGIVDLEKQRVEIIVPKESPWARYDARRKKCANTAAAHYDLALWCKGLELDTEYHDELERTIQLDANHEAARVALGFKKNKKGKWFRPKSSRAPTQEELAAKRRQEDEEKLVRKLVTEWFIKIKAIHKGRLGGDGSSASGDKLANGREQILAIHDPLAIPAISGVLSTGNVKARSVMVESLAQFKEDEATMNLLVASLLDPDEGVRMLAAQALFPRHDERVESRLIDALYSDEELIIRHAAVVLGTLKSHAAIEHLINVLSKETRQKVVVNRHVILGGVRSDFGGINRYVDGNRVIRYQPTTINCLGRGTMIGTFSSLEMHTVMIHRTEVQEALIAITGQNHGFDQEAWSNWLIQQQKP